MAEEQNQDDKTPEQVAPADAAWQAVLVALREAEQLGLPTTGARRGIARELNRLAKVLRTSALPDPAPPALKIARVPTVEIQPHSWERGVLRIDLDRILWKQLGSPTWVALIATPEGWRVEGVSKTDARCRMVHEGKSEVSFSSNRNEQPDLTEGRYRAELVEQAIEIREVIPPGEAVVWVRRDPRRRALPYRLYMAQQLWQALGSPPRLAVLPIPKGLQIVQAGRRDPRCQDVYRDKGSPYIPCNLEDLRGLAEGLYRAELIEQSIVIRETLRGEVLGDQEG